MKTKHPHTNMYMGILFLLFVFLYWWLLKIGAMLLFRGIFLSDSYLFDVWPLIIGACLAFLSARIVVLNFLHIRGFANILNLQFLSGFKQFRTIVYREPMEGWFDELHFIAEEFDRMRKKDERLTNFTKLQSERELLRDDLSIIAPLLEERKQTWIRGEGEWRKRPDKILLFTNAYEFAQQELNIIRSHRELTATQEETFDLPLYGGRCEVRFSREGAYQATFFLPRGDYMVSIERGGEVKDSDSFTIKDRKLAKATWKFLEPANRGELVIMKAGVGGEERIPLYS